MAVNPNTGGNRGSRYIPDRLVGPGVIEQNSYIDIVKANLHIGEVSPVPTEIFDPVAFDDTIVTGSSIVAPAGSIVKLINTTSSGIYVAFAGAPFDGEVGIATATTVYLHGNSHLFTVLPAGLTVLKASATGIRAEIIEDN